MEYPKSTFVGTPKWVVAALNKACEITGVNKKIWAVPLQAISRYETDNNKEPTPSGTLRGMMQQDVGQYASAHKAFPHLVPKIDYSDPVQAGVVTILYIKSELPGYGGYHGMRALLRRGDRGPGNVLRAWIENPKSNFGDLRKFYNGY